MTQTNADHDDRSVLLRSTRRGVQDGDDVVRRSAVPRWNSHHAVGRRVQCYIMPTRLLW